MSKQVKTKSAIFTLWVFLLLCTFAHAELKIDSVYPTIGKMGEPLNVTIKGNGFDKNTRVSMAVDSGNTAKIIGSVDTPGDALNVIVVGRTAYIADDFQGLQVIDITTPTNPKIIGSIGPVDNLWFVSSVTVVDNRAYIANHSSGLKLVDITSPENPQIIGSVDTPGIANSVTVFNGEAYIADGSSGLQVIDISNPENPQIIGSIDTPGNANSVTIVDDRAYIADAGKGLQVIDITNPTNPKIIGSVDTPGNANSVTVVDDRAYISDGVFGLQMIDISNPEDPQIKGSVDTPGIALSVIVVDGKAYIADKNFGLQVVDITNSAKPTIIGSYTSVAVAAFDVTVVEGKAYIADRYSGLKVVDITNPAKPQIIGSVDTPGDTLSITVVDGKAYIADKDYGLQVVDISNPANPIIIGSVDMMMWANAVTVVDSKAYITDDSSLHVVDITNPANPIIIGTVYGLDGASGVTVVDGKAYIARHCSYCSGLKVVDITNPVKPKIIGSVDTPGSASDVSVVDGRAYVADGESGLQVIDITNPANPQIIGSVDTPEFAGSVTVVDGKAYIADGGSGLQVIDISKPAQPVIIGSVDTSGVAINATIIDAKAYIADGIAGLVIVPVPVEVTPTIIDSTTLSLTLPSPQIEGNYNLRVFNNSGASSELRGAVSFLKDEDYQQKTEMKAIIVLGGKYPNNPIWEETRLCANFAYKTLLSQGYTHENIYYLSDEPVDVDKDGFTDVDGTATSANISYAINEWALNASELLLYMVDHGGNGTFVLSKTEKYFKATDLDNWLDNLQSTMTGRVVVVYDACYSGSFIPLLTPPPGKERIVITSAKEDEQAWFATQGILSFSYQFWASAYMKGNLYDAYLDAKHMVATFEKPTQNPMLDADGNGTGPDKDDQRVVSNIAIGRGRSAAAMPPEILEVSPDQTLDGETFAEVWAKIDVNALSSISRVFAVIKSPEIDLLPTDQAVADLPEIELVDVNSGGTTTGTGSTADGTFEGSYNDFKFKGEYTLYVYAVDTEGVYSIPNIIKFNQTKGLSPNVNLTPTNTVLTDSSPSCSIASGEYVKVYGSAGVNTVNVASGARVECINFPGQNKININESSSNFTVKRSGAMVTLQSSTGTMLKIPATLSNQTIKFTTDSRSFTLVISNSGTGGKVKLGSLEVGLTEMKL